MTKMKKVTMIVFTSILILSALAFLGFRGFVSSIRNQRTCEWANIDNIELHAHVDVPKVTQWNCDYEKVNNTKKASFTIDKKKFDADKYIQTYKLKPVNSAMVLEHDKFLNLEKSSLSSDLYYKKSDADEQAYYVLLDKLTARLWVTIKYKD